MTFIWNRRRPSLGQRITGSVLLMVAAVGLSVGGEILSRRLRSGSVELPAVRRGRRARGRASTRKGKGKILSTARS
jgi:hypothetical protein